MRDKRRHKRVALNDFKVSGEIISAAEMISAAETKVVDISISGIALKVNGRLNIGSEYSLTLEGKTAISLRGTVKWCSLIETTEISDGEMMSSSSGGLQFKNMSPERKTELLNFILIRQLETSWKQADKFADEGIPVISTEFMEIDIESLDSTEKDR